MLLPLLLVLATPLVGLCAVCLSARKQLRHHRATRAKSAASCSTSASASSSTSTSPSSSSADGDGDGLTETTELGWTYMRTTVGKDGQATRVRSSFSYATALSALPLALKATFLCFPMVSSLAFRTFHLDCLDNGRASAWSKRPSWWLHRLHLKAWGCPSHS